MIRNEKISPIHQILEEGGAEEVTHIMVAVFPDVLATGINAWQAVKDSAASTESKVEFVLNAVAIKIQEYSKQGKIET